MSDPDRKEPPGASRPVPTGCGVISWPGSAAPVCIQTWTTEVTPKAPRSLLLSLGRVPVSFLNWVMVDLVEGPLPASHCAEYLLVLTAAP